MYRIQRNVNRNFLARTITPVMTNIDRKDETKTEGGGVVIVPKSARKRIVLRL
jgi:hypothetical protein